MLKSVGVVDYDASRWLHSEIGVLYLRGRLPRCLGFGTGVIVRDQVDMEALELSLKKQLEKHRDTKSCKLWLFRVTASQRVKSDQSVANVEFAKHALARGACGPARVQAQHRSWSETEHCLA
jgi:hypothetical protein